MRKGIAAILMVILFILVGCEETTLTVISSTTTVYNFSVKSKFDSSVSGYDFTIDTVNHLIYNEDSLDYGTRVDSLTPYMTQTFTKVMFADTINFYSQDTVYIDFTNPQKMTVKSSSGDTASYWITVNVHTVPQDSFVWKRLCDLKLNAIEKQKAVITDEDVVYWMTKIGGVLGMMSSEDGVNWSDESVIGLPWTADVEHLIACEDGLNILNGNDLYIFDGSVWKKSNTTTSIRLRHLLFMFRGEKYALGEGNVILKLVGGVWKTAAELQSGFPVEGESAFVGYTEIGLPMAYVACGIDETGNYLRDVWSTENGVHWVKLNVKDNICTPRANAAVLQYGEGLLMIGGTTRDSLAGDNILFSKDYGMTWQEGDDVYEIDTIKPRGYSMREGLSMVMRSNGVLYIVGGKGKNGIVLSDVWKGVHYSSIPGFE